MVSNLNEINNYRKNRFNGDKHFSRSRWRFVPELTLFLFHDKNVFVLRDDLFCRSPIFDGHNESDSSSSNPSML